ncbi:MAG: shikimate dehydrogenase [Gammaproteobacteria bacterium]|nr:MAG: shikimate dehydrogenase [Gammaproteobacteria bacterium]
MTDRYGVIGNPIKHSKSPQIHALFARQTGQDISYDAIFSDIGKFIETVRSFQFSGGKGLNVTVPFKQEAWELADKLSERARLAGAVNTLLFNDDGSISGDNTDGAGMVADIKLNLEMDFSGKKVLILGAGGAVRGVLLPVINESPADITIANRTVSKAVDLAAAFANDTNIHACGFNQLEDQQFDIIINGTSAGLGGKIPPIPASIIGNGCCCYDMVYSDEPTTFVKWAQNNGAAISSDGLGMLVGQAAESFYIWREVMPETRSVMQVLRPY